MRWSNETVEAGSSQLLSQNGARCVVSELGQYNDIGSISEQVVADTLDTLRSSVALVE